VFSCCTKCQNDSEILVPEDTSKTPLLISPVLFIISTPPKPCINVLLLDSNSCNWHCKVQWHINLNRMPEKGCLQLKHSAWNNENKNIVLLTVHSDWILNISSITTVVIFKFHHCSISLQKFNLVCYTLRTWTKRPHVANVDFQNLSLFLPSLHTTLHTNVHCTVNQGWLVEDICFPHWAVQGWGPCTMLGHWPMQV